MGQKLRQGEAWNVYLKNLRTDWRFLVASLKSAPKAVPHSQVCTEKLDPVLRRSTGPLALGTATGRVSRTAAPRCAALALLVSGTWPSPLASRYIKN